MSSGDRAAGSLADAYAACGRLARQHYENFPVASLLLPRAVRPHVAAVYAFARTADDFADEDERPAVERQALLDYWIERLRAAVESRPGTVPVPGRAFDPATHDAVFGALGHTIRERRLPVRLFEDLVSAFRQDTVKTRYETFDEVLDYCRRSANPVGRLVLRIAGCESNTADRASDCVCTALQLTNFWQDFGRDWRRGRLYVPLSEMRAAGAAEQDLRAATLTEPWRRLVASLVARTRQLFLSGRDVADTVRGRLSLELRLTWLGGWRILDRVEQQGFDVLTRRPTLRRADVPALLWQAATWRRAVRSRAGGDA